MEEKPTTTFVNIQQVIAIAIVFSFIAIVMIWVLFPPQEINQQVMGILQLVFGSFLSSFSLIVGYYFGSSQGSKSKDEAQNRVIENLTGAGQGNGAMMAAARVAAKEVAPPAAEVSAPPAAKAAAPAAAKIAVAEALKGK